jgi:RNA polymerase sigma-70 factor (ECF subfamily)
VLHAPSTDLHALYERGRDTWPQIDVDLLTFSQYVTARVALDEVDRLHAGDLYLSVACARGDARAITLVDEHYIARLVSALPGFIQQPVADDVIQLVRLRFLFGERGASPRIGDFNGTASLATWLRVAAIRIAISLHRQHDRETMVDDLDAVADAPDPELALLQQQYGAEFRAAFRQGFVSLTPRERNLIRLHIVDRLGIDHIAALYGVHRATAARRLARARSTLIKRLRRELQARLQLDRKQLEGVLALLQGKLELSLRLFLTPSLDARDAIDAV